MTGFLGRLAAVAVGETPRLQARLPSRYETTDRVPEWGEVEQIVTAAPPRPAENREPAAPVAPDPPTVPGSTTETPELGSRRVGTERPDEPANPRDDASREPAPAADGRAAATETVASQPEVVDSRVETSGTTVVERIVETAVLPTVEAPEPRPPADARPPEPGPAEPRHVAFPEPIVRVAPPEPPDRRPPVARRPPVSVHIASIDVRATPPPAPKPAPEPLREIVEAAPSTAPDLEAYLAGEPTRGGAR